MKQMCSRFRLLTLLIVCAFLLTIVLCTGHVLKTTGISLSSLSSISLPVPGQSASPGPSALPDPSPAPESTPDPWAGFSVENTPPGTDNPPEEEYNVVGL